MSGTCQLIGGTYKPTMVRRLEFKCKNAKIFFRLLPMPKICWENVKILDDRETIYVRYLQELESSVQVPKPSYWCFKTDGVFYNNTQAEIYDTIVPELLENVVKGHHAIIFSFGQTGTGKSLTSIGIENSYEDRGIVPRLIANLYSIRDECKNKFKMCFKLSYVEATTTHLRDLLQTEETNFDVHSMKEVSFQMISNEQEMLKAVYKAEGRKTLTKNPAYSSHAASSVLTIMVISKQFKDSSVIRTYSKIHVVDLAGADSAGNKPSLDKNLEEIATGNLAKSQLEQFLLVLIGNIPEQIVVKQRLNILINYLKDCLHASSMLRFIGHIRADDESLLITLSMLRFGQIVRGLKPKKMQLNRYDDQETKIKSLEGELKELKMQKEIDSMIRNEDMRSNLTHDRLNQLKSVAEDYLKNKIDELTVANISDINTVLQVFKSMFKQMENERAIFTEGGYRRPYDDGTSRKSSNKSVLSQKSSRKTAARSKESIRKSQGSVRQIKGKSRSFTARSTPKGSQRSTEFSDSVVQSKLDSLNNTKSKDSLDKSMKRSRTNASKTIRKPSSTRRKASITSESLKEQLPEESASLPTVLPFPAEAWKSFLASEGCNYDELKSEIDEYESETKRLNPYYMEELRKLQNLRVWLDLCQEKLLEVRMQRELSGRIEKNEEGEIIKSEDELACEEILLNGERQLVQQQEVVLAIQSELQIYLKSAQERRKTINDNFDAFCAEKYKTLVPVSQTSQEYEVMVHNPNKNTEEELLTIESIIAVKEDAKSEAIQAQLAEYEKLRLLVGKQRERMLHDRALNRKWIRSCKS